VPVGGYAAGFAHGHNEDWSAVAGETYYFVKYTAGPGADFASCAGLAYPGALIGWAPTWNAHGVFAAVNTLVPSTIKVGDGAISTGFIQRDAICGVGKGMNLEAVIDGLSSPHWSDGASINLVDTAGRAMANVETYTDKRDALRLADNVTAGANASHFNRYERLDVAQPAASVAGSIVRQAVVDALPGAKSREDIVGILSTSGTILRDLTIATLIVDSTGRLEAWGGTSPRDTPPLHSWNLTSFFDEPGLE